LDWSGSQGEIQFLLEDLSVNFKNFQQLGNDTLGLLDQGQKDMFGIDLVVFIALNDFSCSLCCFLSTFCKSIKSPVNRSNLIIIWLSLKNCDIPSNLLRKLYHLWIGLHTLFYQKYIKYWNL